MDWGVGLVESPSYVCLRIVWVFLFLAGLGRHDTCNGPARGLSGVEAGFGVRRRL